MVGCMVGWPSMVGWMDGHPDGYLISIVTLSLVYMLVVSTSHFLAVAMVPFLTEFIFDKSE